MNVLHLFADWKWTGAAQPTVELCRALKDRGHAVTLACQPDRGYDGRTLPREAAKAGLEPLTEFNFDRRLKIISNLKDIRRVAHWIDAHGIEVVHAHSSLDHLIGAVAARDSKRSPKLVRTNHRSKPLSKRFGEWVLVNNLTDGYLCFSRRILEAEGDRLPSCAERIDPALDTARYPDAGSSAEIRSRYGVGPDDFLFGMVLRVQAHRRFDVVMDAVERALRSGARFKVLVVGRGTRRRELAIEPAQARGLSETIRFAGYLKEDYVRALACFDAMIFPRPGSDGTARALREVQTVGRASVVSDFGILPELVEDGRTGRVVPLEAGPLSEALARLAGNRIEARKMGQAAREAALERYDLGHQADRVALFYERVLQA